MVGHTHINFIEIDSALSERSRFLCFFFLKTNFILKTKLENSGEGLCPAVEQCGLATKNLLLIVYLFYVKLDICLFYGFILRQTSLRGPAKHLARC